jgi:flagella basal body P-ring formation protein FlgA
MSPLRNLLAAAAALALAGARLGAQAPSGPGSDALCTAIARDLTAHFGLEGDLEVELARPWTPEAPLADGWTLSVVSFPPTAASTMIVRCQVKDRSGSQEPTFILRASLWRDAWSVKVPVKAGDPFDASDLEAQRSDALRDRDLVPASIDGGGFIFARSVPVGRLLTWHDIARHPLVRKGETVVVTASEGLLSVSIKGLALESGAQGDTISVRNTESQKIFSALVTDENHVQVQF